MACQAQLRALKRLCHSGYWLVVLLLAACAGTTTGAALPAASLSPSATLVSTTAPTVEATATLAPSATPTPSSTALPSATPTASATVPAAVARFGYPIAWPDQAPADGFFVRHGFASENTWYNPGYWHTGEDWYALEGDTAGAEVHAIAAGRVVYIGGNYPGRVIIVEHAPDLFSMYGHLDPAVAVAENSSVERGQLLGVVLERGDTVPNHLHFEVRSFLLAAPVNGATPRYNFRCGPRCPPGPGYWPLDAPDHPAELGWRNPMHVIGGRSFAGATGTLGVVLVPAQPARASLPLWSAPPTPGVRQEALGELPLTPGARLTLLAIAAGPEDSRATSAQGYNLWYRVQTPAGVTGWVQAAVPSPFELGGDGRPSSVELVLIPAL